MSQENVDTVRRAWEAFSRHENEMVFALYDPEVEIHGGGFTNQVYRGFDGVREWITDWLVTFEQYQWEVEEWIDAGDQVVAVVHSRGRGKLSGVAVERRESHVWALRDGRLWRLRIYSDKDEALKAIELTD